MMKLSILLNNIVDRYTRYILSEERIERKFYNGLLKIAKSHNIKVIIHENEDDLNAVRNPNDIKDKDRAAGFFRFRKLIDDRTNKISFCNYFQNEIHIIRGKRYTPYVFAHELGHYFSIKWYNDYTEESADSYIQYLAKLCLHPIEFKIIDADLMIYAGIDLYYSKKDTEVNGKRFYDMSKQVSWLLSLKKFIKSSTKDELKRRFLLKNELSWIQKLGFKIFC